MTREELHESNKVLRKSRKILYLEKKNIIPETKIVMNKLESRLEQKKDQ